MPKNSTKKPVVTLAQVCEGMVSYVDEFGRFPSNSELQRHLLYKYELSVSISYLSTFAKRAKNISFSEETGASMLTAQVIMNHYKQTFHNIKAVELWYKVFGVLGGESQKELESGDENILEVRVIDATKAE